MGHKVWNLLRSAFIRYAISVFVSIIVAHQTFGGIVTDGWPPPRTFYLKVTVDAPDNVKPAIQWRISQPPFGYSSGWFNNGDTASVWSDSYYLAFRPIAGWTMPADQWLWVPANPTNTFVFGSCSFVSLVGRYKGLFSEPSGPKFESSGFLEIFGKRGLSFTGKISSAGHRYSFSGKFDQTGSAWATVHRAGTSPLSVHLLAGDDTLTGEITNETWTATLLAKSNPFDTGSNPARQMAKYTFAFVGGTNSASQPGGDSFGTMTLDSAGHITLAVTLSDGTKATQKTFLSKDRQLPFYIPLYSGKGLAFGWLQLQDQSELNPPKVKIYRDCNYAGDSFPLNQGDYEYWSQATLFIAGTNAGGGYLYDTAAPRSVKIPYGSTVTLYTNDHFGGTPLTITMDDPCFADNGITAIRSIRVGTNAVPPLPDFGTLTWMKPPAPRAKYYPAGFTNQLQAFVSAYQSGPQTSVLEYNAGQGVFQNGNPSENIINEFSIDSSGRISGPNDLNLTIASSGSFKGSAKNPLTGKVISVSGVILQQQQFARGFFLDGDQSGSVYFGP